MHTTVILALLFAVAVSVPTEMPGAIQGSVSIKSL